MFEILSAFDPFSQIGLGIVALIIMFKFIASVRIVPNQTAQIVERLGRYDKTLGPGFHALIPFVDCVEFNLDLREETMTVEPQECFTRDNVKVHVDGVIYMKVVDPYKASYNITDYRYAAIQLAKTTTRAVIGTIELDRTFEERELINSKVQEVFDMVEDNWGINVTRYEVKNIEPPRTVRNAMEQMMAAEREKRAIIARSEGKKQSMINDSEGKMREMINRSEGEKQRRINAAEGRANEITAIAEATAQSIEKMSEALVMPGGVESVKLRLYKEYISRLSLLAKQENKILLPMNLTDFDGLLNGLGLSGIGVNLEEAAQEIEKVVEHAAETQQKPQLPKPPGGFSGLSTGA